MKLRTCSECGRRRECVECAPERSVDARSEYAGSVAPSVERAETAWLCAACAVEAIVAGFVVVCALCVAAALGAELLWIYVRALVVGEALR